MSLFAMHNEPTRSPYLLEFKAGRMKRDGKTITPDNRKGSVYIHQSDDSLMHFCWKDRKTNKSDDDSDLIVFPDEAVFSKVKQTDQRVFMLTFKTSYKRMFFWLQEADDSDDSKLVKKVNHLLDNPPVPGADVENLFDTLEEDESIANGVDPTPEGRTDSTDSPKDDTNDTEMAESATPPPSTSTSSAIYNTNFDQMAAFSSLLSSIKLPDSTSLTDTLTPEVLDNLLSDKAALEKLKPFLPEPHTEENMRAVIRSPQFLQALNLFNAALKTGDVPLESVGVSSEQVKGRTGVDAFVSAIQAEEDQKKKEASDEDTMETE
eukprot:CFRG2291T1